MLPIVPTSLVAIGACTEVSRQRWWCVIWIRQQLRRIPRGVRRSIARCRQTTRDGYEHTRCCLNRPFRDMEARSIAVRRRGGGDLGDRGDRSLNARTRFGKSAGRNRTPRLGRKPRDSRSRRDRAGGRNGRCGRTRRTRWAPHCPQGRLPQSYLRRARGDSPPSFGRSHLS